jgi:hypothetical protein
MSDTSSLSELARFVGTVRSGKERSVEGRSGGARLTASQRLAAASGDLAEARPERRGVSELLGVVLALSARTRRIVMPKVGIDLDVFAPGGRRAVRMILPRQDRSV